MQVDISSPSNPRLKQLAALRRRRHRDESEVMLVEGYEELELALDAGVRPHTLFICPELIGADRAGTVDRVAGTGAEVVRLSRAAFQRVAYRESPDGWLAVVPPISSALAGLRLGTAPLLLICEHVEKPGNLGAMLRTADAAGVSAVIAARPVTDWGNPNVVRASKGTVFSVPVASSGTDEVVGWLAERGITLVATTPDTDVLLTDLDLTGPVALAVGSEKYGLSDELLAAADVRAKLPMAGRVNSLNVATTAAIALYEAVRQRSATGGG